MLSIKMVVIYFHVYKKIKGLQNTLNTFYWHNYNFSKSAL